MDNNMNNGNEGFSQPSNQNYNGVNNVSTPNYTNYEANSQQTPSYGANPQQAPAYGTNPQQTPSYGAPSNQPVDYSAAGGYTPPVNNRKPGLMGPAAGKDSIIVAILSLLIGIFYFLPMFFEYHYLYADIYGSFTDTQKLNSFLFLVDENSGGMFWFVVSFLCLLVVFALSVFSFLKKKNIRFVGTGLSVISFITMFISAYFGSSDFNYIHSDLTDFAIWESSFLGFRFGYVAIIILFLAVIVLTLLNSLNKYLIKEKNA